MVKLAKSASCVGSVPERLLWLSESCVTKTSGSVRMSPISVGIVPDILVFTSESWLSGVSRSRSDGRVPETTLLFASRICRRVRATNCDGTVPLSKLWFAMTCVVCANLLGCRHISEKEPSEPGLHSVPPRCDMTPRKSLLA